MNNDDFPKVLFFLKVKKIVCSIGMKMKSFFHGGKGISCPIYLNVPIGHNDDDIIGFDINVSALNSAIDRGAQMIALTSPFGAGKSSIIELLKIRRHLVEGKNRNKKEKLFNVSMWSHASDGNLSSVDLHRHLVYEIAKGINPKKGTYFHRRLSDNYGLLKFHINKHRYLFVLLFAAFLWVLGGTIIDQSEWFQKTIPTIVDSVPLLAIAFKILSVVIGLIPFLRSEIIISSTKTEKNRKIEEDEIIDLYRNEVLKPSKHLYKWPFFRRFQKKYIVVIEDLDRSTESIQVITFLKELRKYYTNGQDQAHNINNVIFIVNIKPESLLKKRFDKQEEKSETIYAKLFDFVLDLQTINIDDYETILNSLLKEEKKSLTALGIIHDDLEETLSSAPGMQWLIHGRKLGIREIKHRINKAVLLFSALKDRFSGGDITFEKCAVYSFLSTEFEDEFQNTDDKSFGKLAEMRIKKELTQEQCQEVLGEEKSDEYIATVCELINSRLIDTNYRAYFYNYPRNSRILSYEEKQVKDAILYEKEMDIDDELFAKSDCLDIIESSLKKREGLHLPLPKLALKSDTLFAKALRFVPRSVYTWMSSLNYSADRAEDTQKKIIDVLHLDSGREYYNEAIAKEFCDIWVYSDMPNSTLMELRHKLCREFPDEIKWYYPLFGSSYDPITPEEYDCISFENALALFDINNENLSIVDLDNLLNSFEKEERKEKYVEFISDAFKSTITRFAGKDFAQVLTRYMLYINKIIPEFEEIVVKNIGTDLGNDPLFINYQKLINAVPSKELTEKTLKNITDYEYFYGYSDGVIDQLEENGYIIDAVVMRVMGEKPVQYELTETIEAIKDDYQWLRKKEVFDKVRNDIACNCSNILAYQFLFTEELPIMTKAELEQVKTKLDVLDVLKLIPAALVDEDFATILIDYLNEKYRRNAYQILQYLSTLEPLLAKYCFEHLDFEEMFLYYRISKIKRGQIKDLYVPIMNINDAESKLKFMKITRYVDEEWIEEIKESIVGNDELESLLINVIKECHITSVNSAVLQVINSLQKDYAMTEEIEQKLYDNQMYYKYVASRILRQGRVDLEDETSPLYKEKLRLFVETKDDMIIDYYSQNKEFIQKGMEIGLYKRLSEQKRKMFAGIYQTTDCLLDLLTGGYDEEFILEYLSQISGFTDEKAARTFIDIAEGNSFVLASDDVYNNIHDKLVDPSFKRKYTILRKENGYIR